MSFLSGLKTFFGGEPTIHELRDLEIDETERRLAVARSLSEHYTSAQGLYTQRLDRLLQEKAVADTEAQKQARTPRPAA